MRRRRRIFIASSIRESRSAGCPSQLVAKTIAMAGRTWSIGICGCFDMKDCGARGASYPPPARALILVSAPAHCRATPPTPRALRTVTLHPLLCAGVQCCLNVFFCTPCVLGRAMDAAGLGNCCIWCCCGGMNHEGAHAPAKRTCTRPISRVRRPGAPSHACTRRSSQPTSSSAPSSRKSTGSERIAARRGCAPRAAVAAPPARRVRPRARRRGGRRWIASSGGRCVVWRTCVTRALSSQVLHEVMMNENLVFECAGLTKGVGAPEKETELENA